MKRAKTAWVFWIQIEKRDWFKPVWRSRGANSLNIHFYGYHISIGMPWLQTAVDAYERDGSTGVETTNQVNREGIKTHGRFRFITKKQKL
jgi:hypothetical protein